MNSSEASLLLVPPYMKPSLSTDLGFWLSGHEKETGLVRYLSLVILYLSWHFDESAPLDAFQMALQSLPDDDGPTLLENLAHAPAYSRRGTAAGIEKVEVREAQRMALHWKTQLTRPGLNALRLHARALELFEAMVNPPPSALAECNLKAMLLQKILGSYAPSENAPSSSSVAHFQSAMAALEHLMSRANMLPTAPAPLHGAEVLASSALSTFVFEPLLAHEALRKLTSPMAGQESNALHKQVLESMATNTGLRGVSEVPPGNPLSELYSRFPHFHEPLEFISEALALAACGDEGSPVRIPPILLKGPPGTGKTFFAQELSRVLGTRFFERDLSVTSEAFVLTGLDASWKNSKPGLVFDALVNGSTANPLISLNEVDKCDSRDSRSSAAAALYSLLEPASSRIFKDEFIGVPLDASKIIWVLTANDGPVPEPIMSRLETFYIALPSAEQCREIAKSVWIEVLNKHMPKGSGFPSELPENVLTLMSKLSPRLMRKALMRAAGIAARNQSKLLTPDLLERGLKEHGKPLRGTMGFLS